MTRAARIVNGKPVISERVFTAQVIRLAQFYKWRVAHFRPAMTKRGRWVTAVQGDGVGFVDIVLVKSGFLILAELKSDKGKLAPEQEEWAIEFKRVAGVSYYIWRPKDYDQILEVLSK